MATAYTTAHIIDNQEVAITECGLMLTELPERTDDGSWTQGPFRVGQDITLWDDQPTPAGTAMCGPCFTTYNAPATTEEKPHVSAV